MKTFVITPVVDRVTDLFGDSVNQSTPYPVHPLRDRKVRQVGTGRYGVPQVVVAEPCKYYSASRVLEIPSIFLTKL